MPAPSFEESDIHYAYSTLHHFFDVFSISDARQYVGSAFIAATGHKLWKQDVPAHLLFFMEKIQALCNVAFALRDRAAERTQALTEEPEGGVPDISLAENYVVANHYSNAWSNFPRNLTAPQYYNPYRAIRSFCKYMPLPKWIAFLKDLTEHALSNTSINEEEYRKHNILKIRLLFLQLVEACHLIHVRTYVKEFPKENQDE